ncbi:MAG: hypothetical protein RL154_1458, partial [Pseudomonadota bacterium]
ICKLEKISKENYLIARKSEIADVKSELIKNEHDIVSPELCSEYDMLYKKIYDIILFKQTQERKKELDNKIVEIYKNSGFLNNLIYSVFKIGMIKNIIDKATKSFNNDIGNVKSEFILSIEIVAKSQAIDELCQDLLKQKDTLEENISDIEQNLGYIENEILNISKDIDKHQTEQTSINNEIVTIKKELEQDISVLSNILQASHIKNNVKNVCELVLEFIKQYDIYQECIASKPELLKYEYDKTYRTDNFYLALHLLEGLYFLKQEQRNVIKKTLDCPNCSGTLTKNSSKNTLECNKCKCECYLSNVQDALTELNVQEIIENNGAKINEISYICKINHSGKKKFLNVERGTISKNIFEDLMPIFPIVATTCNSFTGVISKRQDKEFVIPKDYFDFLMIDEAGTILPSKMPILYSAKKVMLFGDTLQLKPVCSFTKTTERKLMSFFIKDTSDLKNAATYFSCASNPRHEETIFNNSMDIANNSTNFLIPYNNSALDGDIWLKEHYRCKDNIAKIANEIAYSGEMVLCAGNGGYLEFVECGGSKDVDKTNKVEVESIFEYIEQQKDKFCTMFNIEQQKYYESIGIITPFSNQELAIKNRFSDISITVGTVHKFQGSARDIIIFSTVYNKDDIGKTDSFFFNKEYPDLINVAITRAKKAFIVFGNRDALKDEETYSGKMIKTIC